MTDEDQPTEAPSIAFQVRGIRFSHKSLGRGQFQLDGRTWKLMAYGGDEQREAWMKEHGANPVSLILTTAIEPSIWSEQARLELQKVASDIGGLLGYGSGGIGWLHNWRLINFTAPGISFGGGPGAMVNEPEIHTGGPLGFRSCSSHWGQFDGVMPQWLQHAAPRLPLVNEWLPFRAVTALLANGRGRLQFMTERCLSLASALEMIRHSFKTKVLRERNLYDNEDWVRNSQPRQRAHFRWVHEQLCAELGIAGAEDALPFIVAWRNRIVHEGEILGASKGQEFDGMLYVQAYLDTLLLAAFEWEGCFEMPWRLAFPHDQVRPFKRELMGRPFQP